MKGEEKSMREWLKDSSFMRLLKTHLFCGAAIAFAFSIMFWTICEFSTVLLIFITIFGAYQLGAVRQMCIDLVRSEE